MVQLPQVRRLEQVLLLTMVAIRTTMSQIKIKEERVRLAIKMVRPLRTAEMA